MFKDCLVVLTGPGCVWSYKHRQGLKSQTPTVFEVTNPDSVKSHKKRNLKEKHAQIALIRKFITKSFKKTPKILMVIQVKDLYSKSVRSSDDGISHFFFKVNGFKTESFIIFAQQKAI